MRIDPREKRQFRALARLFAYRFFDTDIIQARGELGSLLTQFAALLIALSFVICVVMVPGYMSGRVELQGSAGWPAQEFLISTTMAVIGIFTLVLWDALFPDRRDSIILGSMPVRMRTVFSAKITAIAGVLSLAILAVNSCTGFVYPFVTARSGLGGLGLARFWGAHWAVEVLAAVFIFLLLVSLQGVAILVLPHAAFLRWSSILQSTAFFGILSVYFLVPPLANPHALASPASAVWLRVLPSYWFLGLFQVLTGSSDPIFKELARRAALAIAAVAGLSSLCFLLIYARQMRRAIEQSGVVPNQGSFSRRLADGLITLMSRSPREHAVLAFISRTLARSRSHRSLIALYAGMGFAYVFSGVAHVLYSTDFFDPSEKERTAIGIPLLMLFFLIIGIRVSFSIPIEVRANWLFRMTDPFGAGAYFSAARKALLTFVLAPILAISAVAYGGVWPWSRTFLHVGFIAVLGMIFIEMALTRWDKVPFACTYLPGRANLKVMFGVYWGLLFILSEIVEAIEYQSLRSPKGYAILIAFALAVWIFTALRSAVIRARLSGLRFEDRPEPVVEGLGIAEMGIYGGIDRPSRPFPARGERLPLH